MSNEPVRPGTLARLTDQSVFDLLAASGPLARTQLAAQLGISKPTASQGVRRLVEHGLVRLAPAADSGRRGPNAELYEVDPGYGHLLAASLQASGLRLQAVDLAGRVLFEQFQPLDAASTAAQAEHFAASMAQAARQAAASPRLAAAVSQAAPVIDRGGRRTAQATAIFLASGADLAGALGGEVLLENDVNAMASALAVPGDSMLLLYVGAGLGAALVLDGVVHRGARGTAGELERLEAGGASLFERLVQAGLADVRVRYELLDTAGTQRAFASALAGVLGNLLAFIDPQRLVLAGPGASATLAGQLAAVLGGSEQFVVQYEPAAGLELAGVLAAARHQALQQLWEQYRLAPSGAER